MSTIKAQIQEDMKAAMRAKDKPRLDAIRLIMASFKQYEVDKREDVDDTVALTLLDKLAKQRRESIQQFTDAGRTDLVDKEQQELEIIQNYLPAPLSEEEITALIDAAIAESGAQNMQDMGKVMGILKPQVQGRADMGKLSATIKSRLSA